MQAEKLNSRLAALLGLQDGDARPAELPAAAASPSRELPFALIVSAVFAVIVALTASTHEMWRDELNAWLFARDAANPLDLLPNTRYEGHPPLWFFLLWPVARLTRNPYSIQWVAVAVATAAAFVISWRAPLPRWLRAAAVFGYFPLYEYGVMARNYGLGVLGLACFCVLYPKRREKPVWVGLALAAVLTSSMVAFFVGLAALAVLVLEAVAKPPERARRPAMLAGLAVALGGLAICLMQVAPKPDLAYRPHYRFSFDAHAVVQTMRSTVRAFLTLPTPGADFWLSDAFSAIPGYYTFGVLLSVPILALAGLALLRRRLAFLYFAFATTGLLLFFYVMFVGALRHWGFLYVTMLTAFWLSSFVPATRLPGRWEALAVRAEAIVRRAGPLLLLLHVLAAGVACWFERTTVFSAAKATAARIRELGLEKLPLVADKDYTFPAVVGYLGKDQVRYAHGDRDGSYIIWNAGRDQRREVWGLAREMVDKHASPVVVVLDSDAHKERPAPDGLGSSLRTLGCLEGHPESFCLFVLSRPGLPLP